jgi:hypothetical protein
MQLNGIEADADRALCSIDKAIAHALHVLSGHLARQRPIGAERDHGRSDGLPSILIGRERLSPLPWPPRRGLSTGMSELDAELGGAVTPAVGDYTGKGRFAVVGIESEAAVADPPTALDAGGLNDEQRRSGVGKHTEVIEVPVGRHAVIRAVLAHRRNNDAVPEFEIGKPDRRKQGAGHVRRVD